MIADIVEQQARNICKRRGIDPDKIIDEYGPVCEWCRDAYHIGEAVKAATESLRDQIAADKRRIVALEAAVLAVVEATRDYLPPDGITALDCINRVLLATDNPEIYPFVRDAEPRKALETPDV